MTTLGKEIKKARIDKGLKQKDLMALTGMPFNMGPSLAKVSARWSDHRSPAGR